jgi:tetratricopeptide (TPR) repeat protein
VERIDPQNRQIATVRKLMRERKLDEALLAADQIVEQFPQDLEALLFRAHVRELRNEWDLAIADTSQAIHLSPDKIALYYNRTRFLFALGRYAAALEDINAAFEVSLAENESYYVNELHGWRAEILLRLGRLAEARADIEKLDDDYRTWTDQLRTKQDMLRDAGS